MLVKFFIMLPLPSQPGAIVLCLVSQKVDIPVITYRKKPGGGMDLDTSKCSQEEERARLLIIASLTPFDSFRIGEEFLRCASHKLCMPIPGQWPVPRD